MERIIRISNKDYKMKASAMTQFNYRNETGRSFLKDLQKLSSLNFEGLSEEDSIDKLEDITELVLKVAYTMIKQADKNQVVNYEDFLDNIEDLYGDVEWLNDVIELACSPLSRQLQKN
jgi:hypothetical protein